jgi:hypothetical protein
MLKSVNLKTLDVFYFNYIFRWKKNKKQLEDCKNSSQKKARFHHVTKTGCDYSSGRDRCIQANDGSLGTMMDFSLTNNSINLQLNKEKKFKKKTRISCKKLSLISKKKPFHSIDHGDEDVSGFELKRVCSQKEI